HIVAGVAEGRVKAGVQPQGVAAQRLDVVQLFDDAGQVADAVAVRIPEALGVDLVENALFQPVGHKTVSFRGALPWRRCTFYLKYIPPGRAGVAVFPAFIVQYPQERRRRAAVRKERRTMKPQLKEVKQQ